jgi:hypothetical protein
MSLAGGVRKHAASPPSAAVQQPSRCRQAGKTPVAAFHLRCRRYIVRIVLL